MELNAFLAIVSEWLGVLAVTFLLGLSARLKEKPLIFRYPQREGVVSFSLFVLILLFESIFYSSGAAASLTGAGLQSPELLRGLVLAALALIPFALALLIRRQPLRSAGWGRDFLMIGLRLGFAFALLTIFLRGKIFSLLNGVTAAEGVTLLLALGLVLAEESIFRGFLQMRLMSWLGETRGWLLTALLFVVWRGLPYLQGDAIPWLTLLITAVQGLLLGWIARKSRHVVGGVIYRAVSIWIQFLT